MYVLEKEFLSAHTHSIELSKVKDKLAMFNILKDDRFDQKEITETINKYENLVSSGCSDFHKYLYQEIIIRQKEALLDLTILSKNQNHENTVDTVLNMLVEKKLKCFSLILDTSERFSCEIKLQKKIFIITIPRINTLSKTFWFDEYKLSLLMNLGFNFYPNKNKLTVKLKQNDTHDLLPIKTLLSRLVFEVLGHNQFRESYIQYGHKVCR